MANRKKYTQEPIDINYRMELGEFTDLARRIERSNMALVQTHDCSVRARSWLV